MTIVGNGAAGDRLSPARTAAAAAAAAAETPAATRAAAIDADAIIDDLAARQHGLVSRRQLLAAGIPSYTVDYRLERGRLRRVLRSVYRAGPLRSPHEREAAAVLSSGGTSVLSHHAAAIVWELIHRPAASGPVDLIVRDGSRVTAAGVRIHRCTLRADEATLYDGIPITAPARTLLDIAPLVDVRQLELALARADRQNLATYDRIADLIGRYPRRAGVGRLRALLAASATPSLTRSEAERRFLELVRRGQLRAPEVNVKLRGFEVDFLWRAERLVVEVDGREFHSSRTAFEVDRRRDAVLAAAGLRVMRVTWQQLSNEAEALLVRLGLALARVEPGGAGHAG
jgi:very-short-patch-repair endonuclease